jgi:hypothetical protein
VTEMLEAFDVIAGEALGFEAVKKVRAQTHITRLLAGWCAPIPTFPSSPAITAVTLKPGLPLTPAGPSPYITFSTGGRMKNTSSIYSLPAIFIPRVPLIT